MIKPKHNLGHNLFGRAVISQRIIGGEIRDIMLVLDTFGYEREPLVPTGLRELKPDCDAKLQRHVESCKVFIALSATKRKVMDRVWRSKHCVGDTVHPLA